MPQTRPNGTVVPINSDDYSLTSDLAKMADTTHVAVPVANKAARDALTTYPGMQVVRLDRDNWIQTYTGQGSTGWEYRSAPRRVDANVADFQNASGTASRLLYTMPGVTKPYPQTYRAVCRLGISVAAITSGNLWVNVAVSGATSSVATAQGKFGLAYFAPGNYLQSGTAETPWMNVAANTDPFIRAWVEVLDGLVTHAVSVQAPYSQFYAEVRPQDD
ncbi:hypothetical protein ACFRJ8_14670 [Arthrobacter sp. NPDC056886]|uniref:hypothetical protein n=1 Tax=Arthrobacter sp. NPDC056886 TaxID=3345960 RepID=UPI00366F1E0F